MSPSFSRVIGSLLLAPSVALSAAIPPEHLHRADADHRQSLVHRHLEPHHAESEDHDGAQLADDDAHVAWLDNLVLRQTMYRFVPAAGRCVERFELAPQTAVWVAKPDWDAAPSHGPPRASVSPRAPPPLSA